MRIAIIGYGKMGSMVENEANRQNIAVSKIINNRQELISCSFDEDEVAIEFTEPTEVLFNLDALAKKGINIVCGTTGWYQDIDKIEKIVSNHNVGLLYASNFAIGVHVFWNVVKTASMLMNKCTEYDVFLHETHHKGKKDGPSGTALSTAHIVLDHVSRKKKLVTDVSSRGIADDEMHVSFSRGGHIIGEHCVIFDSEFDDIKISHSSKNRKSYAKGAVDCAKWIQNKKGLFKIDDYMEDLLYDTKI